MKRFIQLTILSFLGMLPICSDQLSLGEKDQKIYVYPDQLAVFQEGIFVYFDNAWYETEALFSDERGIYIQKFWPQDRGCGEDSTRCRNCNRCVKEYYDICPYCHKPVYKEN